MTEKKKEPEVIDIKKLDTDKLKVLAYDLLTQLGRLQQQINAIQAEIDSRG